MLLQTSFVVLDLAKDLNMMMRDLKIFCTALFERK